MNTKQIVLIGWLIALGAVSLAGMGVVPSQGVALPTDEGPQGAAILEEMIHADSSTTDRIAVSTSSVIHDTDRTLFVVAPERAPLSGEATALDRFLEAGGTAVLFVATDAWNDALSPYGITLHGSLLLDSRDDEAPSSFPLELPDSLGGGTMVLVGATAITDPGPEVETVTPDRELVLDLDGDEQVSVPPDTAGRFPTIAQTAVGSGKLVVVASGDTVLNENIDRQLDAMERLVRELAGGRGALLDASTHRMGIVDVAREPARLLAALFHGSLGGLGVGIVSAGLAVYASPRLREDESQEGSKLDERTDQTQEWLKRGNP